MSPLPTSSVASLRDNAFPLPLFPQSRDRLVETTVKGTQHLRSLVLDIAVASGILALLVALLVPTLNRHDLTLPSVTRGLVDHLRLARAGATSQGTHFRITFYPQTYAIEQLQDRDGNGAWEPDPAQSTWQVTLPPPIAIRVGARTVIEFDAKGFISTAPFGKEIAPMIVELRDSQTEKSELIEILSSGKVQRS